MFGQPADDTDIWAMKNNYISVTPLQFTADDADRAAEVEESAAGDCGGGAAALSRD